MNAAKRKSKSREKLKSDESKWKTAQENQKKYDQKRREKGKALRESNEKSMIQWREKERLRKRKQREKKKLDGIMKTCDSPLGSYKTINTLKKAVVKLKKALPESPNKKSCTDTRFKGNCTNVDCETDFMLCDYDEKSCSGYKF